MSQARTQGRCELHYFSQERQIFLRRHAALLGHGAECRPLRDRRLQNPGGGGGARPDKVSLYL